MHRPLRPACLSHKIESNIPSLNHHKPFLFFKYQIRFVDTEEHVELDYGEVKIGYGRFGYQSQYP